MRNELNSILVKSLAPLASLVRLNFLKPHSTGPQTAAGQPSETPFADAALIPSPANPVPVAINFDNVAFAGGGNRCFWQAGFWTVAAPQLDLRPKRVTAVSAGAAMACALFSGGFDQGFRSFLRAVAENHRNLNIRNLLNQRPLFPHGEMYRNAILTSITEPALARLHAEGPEIFVLVSCPPGWAGPGVALMLGALANGVDTWLIDGVHSSVGRRIGFAPEFLPIRECASPEALADLIMASSCVPPLTPQARRNGVALLDGGLVDNVPTDFFGHPSGNFAGNTLVLLSQHFKRLPAFPGRVYVQPSQPIPVGALDYTDGAGLQATFDLGRRDAEAFCAASRHDERNAIVAA